MSHKGHITFTPTLLKLNVSMINEYLFLERLDRKNAEQANAVYGECALEPVMRYTFSSYFVVYPFLDEKSV